MPTCLSETVDGVILKLKVLPRAAKNQLVGVHGDCLKVKLTAPPVDGAANQACCRFLAQVLGVPNQDLEILSGTTARQKRVLVKFMTKQQVAQRIGAEVDNPLKPKG